jgi:hypothetical protein
MNSAGKIAALLLLTAFLAGCRHKTKVTPPPAAQAPVLPVSQSTKNLPPPKMPPPELPAVGPASPATTPPKPKPHKSPRHRIKHTESAPAPAKNQEPTAASNGATDMTPIGQITEAGGSTNTPRRNQILDEINSTEKGLNDIKRTLSKDEQTTAAQIRTFLAKARDALNQEDLDGAHTLVTKAKVLLDELTKS